MQLVNETYFKRVLEEKIQEAIDSHGDVIIPIELISGKSAGNYNAAKRFRKMERENKIKKEGDNYTMSVETAKLIKFGDSENYQRYVSDAIGKYFEYCVYK